MYAVVDLETTGGNARWHRITEVAIFVHDGVTLVEEYSSLVNPGTRIPPFITQLTGITNEMVADAPPFEAIAHIVHQLTEGCVFVAHNVNFDYNFLKAEFARIGRTFERARLCTVRSSRKLLPGHQSYSLGRICADLGIGNQARHRAAGDARATMYLMEEMLSRHGNETFHSHIIYQSPYQAYEGLLHSLKLEDLPARPGILRLLNPVGELIGIEVAGNLQKRALHLVKRKAAKLARGQLSLLFDIQAEETGSMLLANVLIEAEKVAYGKAKVKKVTKRWKVNSLPNQLGYLELLIAEAAPGEPSLFKTKKAAQEALTNQISSVGLCRHYSNLRPKRCHDTCSGACRQTITPDLYNKLAATAYRELQPQAFTKRILLDKGRHPQEFSVLVEEGPDRWRWGYAETQGRYVAPEELADAAYETLSWSGASDFIKKLLVKNPARKEIFYGQ